MKFFPKTKPVFTSMVISLAGASSEASIVAYFPLNDGAPGTLALTADDFIDDDSHPITDATNTGADTDTWEINTIVHPVFDPVPGSKIVYRTGEGNRMRAGDQGIDLADGFSWSFWVYVDDSNLTDSGADVIIGTRSGGSATASETAWHKMDLSGISQWNGRLSYDTLADDQWHHIAYVGDLNGRKIYKDGVEIASDDSVEVNTNSARPFEFGGSSQFSEDITGFYSEVAVWNERLSEERIADLANGGPVVTGPVVFEITDFVFSPESLPTPTVSLTWRNTGAETYAVRFSPDLMDWSGVLNESVSATQDENTDDGDYITVTFPLAGGLENESVVFFRIEQG